MRSFQKALVCSLCLLFISSGMVHAQNYEARLGKKKVHCQVIDGKPVAMVKVGRNFVAIKIRIKQLAKAAKKAKTSAKRARYNRSAQSLRASLKKSQRACANNMPLPTPTPVPTAPISDGASLEPFAGPVSRSQVRLLLERAGYGLSSHEESIVSIAQSQGLDAAVREFMRIKDEPADLDGRIRDRFDNTLGNGYAGGNQMADHLITQTSGYARAELDFAIHTNNPFRSNLQHFFFGLWTVGAEVLNDNLIWDAPQTPLWWDYWTNALYKAALDPKIPDRLIDVARHPAMLIYLSNNLNVKGNVNENFARELMELFSIGTHRLDRNTNQTVENYTEIRDGNRALGDIYRAARCLTGWRVSPLEDSQSITRWRTVFSAADHDENCATTMFEGQPFGFPMTDDISLIRGIFAHHPAARDYLARELLKWFLTPEPPIELVRAFGDKIHAANYDLTEPLRELFISKAFYFPAYVNTLAKTPHQVVVEYVRTAELYRTESVPLANEGGVNISNLTGSSGNASSLYRMNYALPYPTDVFFFRASEWIGSSAQLEVANMFYSTIGDTTTQTRAGWTAAKLLTDGEVSADDLVTRMAERFGCNEQLSADMRAQIIYFMNYRLSGTTYTRNLYDNATTSHRHDKGKYLAPFFAMQPCFRLK